MIKKYIKMTPIGAIRVTPDNQEELRAFAFPQEITFGYEIMMHSINTIEGNMHFSDGDYLIKNETGECYMCHKDIFEKHTKKLKDSTVYILEGYYESKYYIVK